MAIGMAAKRVGVRGTRYFPTSWQLAASSVAISVQKSLSREKTVRSTLVSWICTGSISKISCDNTTRSAFAALLKRCIGGPHGVGVDCFGH